VLIYEHSKKVHYAAIPQPVGNTFFFLLRAFGLVPWPSLLGLNSTRLWEGILPKSNTPRPRFPDSGNCATSYLPLFTTRSHFGLRHCGTVTH